MHAFVTPWQSHARVQSFGLLFLGGGACPSCGSQVAMDITVDDIVMDDETIPGLEEIADAIGDATLDVDKSARSYLSVWVQKRR